MNPGSQRGSQNQRKYRHVNRRFLDVLSRSPASVDGELLPFICECADGDCAGRIDITAWRYEDIHSDERHYVILPGHMRIAGEEIMEENSYYEIVKKAAYA
jgi:hypothetical protein